MRALAIALLCLGGCRMTARAAPAEHGRIEAVTFYSAALGVDKRYLVWLPAGYDDGARRFPVVYLLHGLGGDERDWVEGGHLPETADRLGLRALVVMPDGDASFYADSVAPADYAACVRESHPGWGMHRETAAQFCVRKADYEEYLARDLVADVDARFRTVADRRGRAIAGLSMGGYGALMLAMRHKDRFSAAASHSGVDALLYAGPHPYRRGRAVLATDVSKWGGDFVAIGRLVRPIFGPDLANWRAHDPAVLAGSLRPGELALYLDCGTEDDYQLEDQADYLHDVLDGRHLQHVFALVPGHHDFRLWRERIRYSLAFFADHFRAEGL